MDAAGELAQLLDGGLRVLARLRQQLRRALGVGGELRLREPERHRDGDHPLLGAVVEVALDPPALLLGGVEDPVARAAQVVDAVAQGARPALLARLAWEPDLGHLLVSVSTARRARTTYDCPVRAIRVATLAVAGLLAGAATAEAATVRVGDNWFSPKRLTVEQHSSVTWKFVGDRDAPREGHARAADASSRRARSSGKYVRHLMYRGTYKIVCTIHRGDQKMTLTVE